MREQDEYRKWHIRDSINFYHVLLNQDKTIPELYRFVSHKIVLSKVEKPARKNDYSVSL